MKEKKPFHLNSRDLPPNTTVAAILSTDPILPTPLAALLKLATLAARLFAGGFRFRTRRWLVVGVKAGEVDQVVVRGAEGGEGGCGRLRLEGAVMGQGRGRGGVRGDAVAAGEMGTGMGFLGRTREGREDWVSRFGLRGKGCIRTRAGGEDLNSMRGQRVDIDAGERVQLSAAKNNTRQGKVC